MSLPFMATAIMTLVAFSSRASAGEQNPGEQNPDPPGAAVAPKPPEAAPNDGRHGPSSGAFPSHRFQWSPRDDRQVQLGVNFGLLQLALGGFNVAVELRYRRFWLEYSHGMALTLNNLGGSGMTRAERRQDLHMFVPYTTGFGVGMTLLDELWLGVEWKTHRYEVNAPGGAVASYQTYSIGPVLGYKFFVWRGLHVNTYLRYWPNIATSLDADQVALPSAGGTVTHEAHGFDFFANVSVGYAVDL